MDTLFPAAAPSFDDPIALLLGCHGRIAKQCSTLDKLLAHLPDKGCDAQAQQAATNVLRYFDTAGQHHHHDEEDDLFPALRTLHEAEADRLIDQLLGEHVHMDKAWQALRPMLADIAAARSAALDAAAVAHFIALYEKHIATENNQLLPLAARLLNATQLQHIGQNMAARRGVSV